ncbi:MAG: CoA-binding protein [Pseudomonadota bacterium]
MTSPNILETEESLSKIVREIRTVAVVGMQDERKADRPAFLIPARTRAAGIRVIPVNPMIKASQGEKAYPDLASVPEAFDTVNVFRRSEVLESLVDEILRLPEFRRPAVVWIQSGIRNQRAAEKLAGAGIKVVMDACLGVYVSRYR